MSETKSPARSEKQLPHCFGCLHPDGYNGETHCFGTIEHPEPIAESETLTNVQRRKIEDVIHTLNYGITKGWDVPRESLQACIGVLVEALKGME